MTTEVSTEDTTLLRDVGRVLVRVLGLEADASTLHAGTPLLGDVPELDSLAIVELVVTLEDQFDITLADEDVTGEAFASVGSLVSLVARRRAGD